MGGLGTEVGLSGKREKGKGESGSFCERAVPSDRKKSQWQKVAINSAK